MAQIPFIEDAYIDEIIKSAGTYDPSLNTTQGVKLRELIKQIRDRIEQGGPANESDAYLLARSNHTGTQAISTIVGLQDFLDGKVNILDKGVVNGVATLDGSGKIPLSQINDALLGSVNYKGTYNPASNIPALPAVAPANKGWYYVVSTSGTQAGLSLESGDWIISNGAAWGKVNNNNQVTSVNGMVGAVTGLVDITNNQTIWGIKSFSSGAVSGIIPINATDLTNKSYVDTAIVNASYSYARLGALNRFTGNNLFENALSTTHIVIGDSPLSQGLKQASINLNTSQAAGSNIAFFLPKVGGSNILATTDLIPNLSLYALNANVVHTDVGETITGQKLFTDINRFSTLTIFGSATDQVTITNSQLQRNVGGNSYPLVFPTIAGSQTLAVVSQIPSLTGETLQAITNRGNTTTTLIGASLFIASQAGEAFRITNNDGYIAGYTSGSATTRNGFLQFSNGSLNIQSDQGAKIITLNSAGGNIGIGTTSPRNALDIKGSVRVDDGTNPGIIMGSINASEAYIKSLYPSNATGNLVLYSGYYTFRNASNSPILLVDGNGKVDAASSINATAFNVVSKRSAKKDIKAYIGNAVSEINKIKIKSFTYKDDTDKHSKIGFIADETSALFATRDHDKMDIGSSVGLLLKAVQELSAEVKTLKSQLSKQKSK